MNVYVHWNGGAWFVKAARFFRQQVAERQAGSHEWEKAWRPIYDVDGLEHGRDKAKLIWGERGERWKAA